jgi:hypothetical protein
MRARWQPRRGAAFRTFAVRAATATMCRALSRVRSFKEHPETRDGMEGKEHAPAQGGGAPQNGAAGSAPRHMTPCACHCAACRAAGHGNMCVMVSLALVQLFPENADIVDLVLRHYYHGASGWDTARFDSGIRSVQYGPAGDVIAAGDSDGRIHLICTQTGAKILCHKGHR